MFMEKSDEDASASSTFASNNRGLDCMLHTDTPSHLKEVVFDYFRPFVQFVDQYATLCDEVISAFVHAVLRVFDAITMVRSPIEILLSKCKWHCGAAMRACFYERDLPSRSESPYLSALNVFGKTAEGKQNEQLDVVKGK
ncbi:hypothetical protein Tcan_04008 [Toxocara canis]|uniref:Uncharacterized protein n=1 Tax=Toxocara canis TaxID=6265 RepID=A0A0B2V137_TOXCA|nr:hypothetical protein Tcan_04008 [Toxocara canis]